MHSQIDKNKTCRAYFYLVTLAAALLGIRRLNSGLPLPVPGFHLAKHLFLSNIFSGEEMGQKIFNVGAAQKRIVFLVGKSGLQHIEHGQHHHRHVMVKRLPAANLIMVESHIALCILKGPFYEIALTLHEGKAIKGRALWGVGEAVLYLLFRSDLSADDQVSQAAL